MFTPIKKIIRKVIINLVIFFFCTTISYTIWLKWFPPFATFLIIQRAMDNENDPNTDAPFSFTAKWKSLDNISKEMQYAVIASEDAKFKTHSGVDMDALWEAFKYNMKHDKTRGGSTISQQVAKNVFLWNSRSYIRKGLELYFTFLIELIWGKERIMEVYLNIAETGNGRFGVEAASLHYFNKSAKNLTERQAALIACTLPNPIKYTIYSSFAKGRVYRVQRFMRYLKKENYWELEGGELKE
jgi:monofunctional biosynthetic peptidoglycan transglycosylase